MNWQDGVAYAHAVAKGEISAAFVNPSAMLTQAYRGTGLFHSPLPLRIIGNYPSMDRFVIAIRSKLGFKSLHDVKKAKYPLKISLREDPTHSTLVLIAQLLEHHGMSLDMIKSWGGSVHAIGGPGDKRRLNGVRDGSLDIIAIATETAQALFLAGTYGGSSKRLKGLTWGAEDLSVELGAEANRDKDGNFLAPYQLARSLCLAGAGAAQVQAIDTVYVDFRNEAGFRRECEEAKRDGFTGKMLIHPAQVAVCNEVFTPTPEAIERAKAVVAAFAADPGAGTIGIGGVMYDRPHLERARQLLARLKT